MLAWNLAFSLVCFASTLVLPGFGILYLARQTGLARRLARGTEAASPQVIFCRAIALSTFCVAAIGYLLLALRWFTAGRLALCMLPVGLCGVHLAVQTARPLVRNWRVAAVVGILAVPYAGPVLSGGHSPANNFNWYYWLLGRDLSAAHGVPGWAPEYGIHLRWQPDYLSFSLLTECFRGFSVGVSDATVLDMWKVPVAIFTLTLTYIALRMWLSRPVAVFGLGGLAASVLYTAKLGNARPEIVGFAIGLVALILGIDALRRHSPSQYLMAAALLAVDTSVHAIGALVAGLLLAAFTILESRSTSQRRMVVAGLGLFVSVIAATGWALQGRTFVGGDAAKPTFAKGQDPTALFFELSENARIGQIDPFDRLLDRLAPTFDSIDLGRGLGWVLLGLVVVAAILALVSGAGRAREVAVATVLTAAGLGAAIAWFALRFDTFVPQNTGLSRFAQWAPLICILFLAAGAEAAIARRPVRTDRVNGRTAVMATSALILGTTGAAFVISQSFPPRLGISDEAEHAIAALNRQATPGQILVANVSTRGMLEFLTPVEVPSEARQPVIEAPTVLSAANGHLAELIRYFGGTADINAHRDFGATWVLVTDRPADFAASRTFGPRPAALPDRADLRLVWGGAHVRLYRHHAAGPVEKLGPAHGHLPRTLLAGLFLLVMGCVACAVSGVIRHPRSRVKN